MMTKGHTQTKCKVKKKQSFYQFGKKLMSDFKTFRKYIFKKYFHSQTGLFLAIKPQLTIVLYCKE